MLLNKPITIELFEDQNGQDILYVGTENSSGCEYPIENRRAIGAIIQNYLEAYYLDDIDNVTKKQLSHNYKGEE